MEQLFEIKNISPTDHPDVVTQISELLAAVERNDGVAAFSEQFERGLHLQELGHHHSTAWLNGQLVGIVATDGHTAELAVAPEFRRKKIATKLFDAINTPSLWAHGNLPASIAFAKQLGLEKQRELLVMEIEGADLDKVTQYEIPTGWSVDTLRCQLSQRDRAEIEDKWLEVNNQAFSWHPEQGGWDRKKLQIAQQTTWFKEEDVLFLWDAEQLAGFHWTKQHSEELFEIYVVGLATAYRGRGLGDLLVRIGLHHMRNKGASRIILYVEADNKPAVKAYEKLGFTISQRHVLYQRPQ